MIVLDLVIGVIFVAANFSNSLKHLAGSDEVARLGLARVMTQVSQAPKDVLGASTAALGQWLTVCFLGLWLYLGALAILALARRRLTIIGVGLAGLIAGVLSLAVLSWVGMLLWGVLWLVRRIFHILQTVLQAIGHLLVWLLLYTWPVLTVAAVVTVVVILWKRYGPVRILIGTTCAALLYLLGPVFRAIWEGVLLPVLRWLGRLLGVLFGWLGVGPRVGCQSRPRRPCCWDGDRRRRFFWGDPRGSNEDGMGSRTKPQGSTSGFLFAGHVLSSDPSGVDGYTGGPGDGGGPISSPEPAG